MATNNANACALPAPTLRIASESIDLSLMPFPLSCIGRVVRQIDHMVAGVPGVGIMRGH